MLLVLGIFLERFMVDVISRFIINSQVNCASADALSDAGDSADADLWVNFGQDKTNITSWRYLQDT